MRDLVARGLLSAEDASAIRRWWVGFDRVGVLADAPPAATMRAASTSSPSKPGSARAHDNEPAGAWMYGVQPLLEQIIALDWSHDV